MFTRTSLFILAAAIFCWSGDPDRRLESVRRLVSDCRVSSTRRIEARRKNASAFRLRFSWIFGEPSAAIGAGSIERSTIRRSGKTTNWLT